MYICPAAIYRDLVAGKLASFLALKAPVGSPAQSPQVVLGRHKRLAFKMGFLHSEALLDVRGGKSTPAENSY